MIVGETVIEINFVLFLETTTSNLTPVCACVVVVGRGAYDVFDRAGLVNT